jgi:signal transduction histidine kinase
MKRKFMRLSRHYAAALQKHLKRGPKASPVAAQGLGRQAVSLGLEILDVAKIHQEALTTMALSSRRDGLLKRAGLFFTEAIIPIEKTHQATLTASAQFNQMNQMLNRRTLDLIASNRSLRQSVVRRETVEVALRKSRTHSEKLLDESRRLQKHLQHLARQILSAQENKRLQISHELQDEIAQTLLGINVRLVALKQESAVNTAGLQKEIAGTRRLVEKSMKSIKRFAREFGK